MALYEEPCGEVRPGRRPRAFRGVGDGRGDCPWHGDAADLEALGDDAGGLKVQSIFKAAEAYATHERRSSSAAPYATESRWSNRGGTWWWQGTV